MRAEITIVHVAADGRADVVLVRNELAALQALVGGYIEAVRVAPTLMLVCNERGRLEELPVTFVVNGEPIAGPFFLTSIESDGEGGSDFAGLSEAVALPLAGYLNRAARSRPSEIVIGP